MHSATYFTTTTTGLGVGGQFGGGGEMPACYMAEWSVRKGECLYTADFTPPSVEESDEAPYASAVALVVLILFFECFLFRMVYLYSRIL